MNLKAIGRHLVVKMETDRVSSKSDGGIIIPSKSVSDEEGGLQFFTVLDVGEYAFDDQPAMRDLVKPGVTVVTTRYPGAAIYPHAEWKDKSVVTPFRLVVDTEVRAIIHDAGALIDG